MDNNGNQIGSRFIKLTSNDIQTESLSIDDKLFFISSKSDLPAPVNGIITLGSNETYHINGAIDLTGDRIVCDGIVALIGNSSETASITSTSLSVGVSLITSAYSLPARNLTFINVDTCLDIDGLGNDAAYDWIAVNFTNIPNIGTVKNCNNFIYINGAFLGSNNLKFDGTIGTIGFSENLHVADSNAAPIIDLLSTLTITRRFRVIYSSFVVLGSSDGIKIDALTTVPLEGFILDTVNFSGAGDPLVGIDFTSNKALFIKCIGVNNTFVSGQSYMKANATATVVADTTTFVKVLGTTTGVNLNKMTQTNNRLTNDTAIIREYSIRADISFTTSNNNVCEFAVYDSISNGILTESVISSTANAGGRSENISITALLSNAIGNYIEIWCRNTTAISNITVTEFTLTMFEI
jgi:hypothetical protein